jgi:hypothetical protein
MGLGVSTDVMSAGVAGLGSLLGLGAAAVIVICAIPTHLGGEFNAESLYALLVAGSTLAAVIGLYYMERTTGQLHHAADLILSAFAVMWVILACLVTFRGPFLTTGNGYFGSWAGAFVSVMAAAEARVPPVTGGDGQVEAVDPDL